MKIAQRNIAWLIGGIALLGQTASAQDWPQWRGPNRDGRANGFEAPATWPKQLTQKWKVAVGDGVATPALVGNRLYVFARQEGNEILRCLDAATGKEMWQDKYATGGATGPASGFAGPRCSPTVAAGKVVVLGVRGLLSCYDVDSGKKLWNKQDFSDSLPRFFTSSSPIITEGLCVAQLGGESGGAIIAYDLSTGAEKWRWHGEGTAYASPVWASIDGTEVIVATTNRSVVGISPAAGKLLWSTPFEVSGRGYNAATPIIEGSTVFYAGSARGTRAVLLSKTSDALASRELWNNSDNSVMFNTPVLKDGWLYGLSDRNLLFCIHRETGKTAWSTPLGTTTPTGPAGKAVGGTPKKGAGELAKGPPGRGGAPGKGGMMGRGGGRGGYGSIVDAGAVLFALTPSAELVVFEPSGAAFKQLAKYQVAAGNTYAHPVIAGSRIFIKDRDSVVLWTLN